MFEWHDDTGAASAIHQVDSKPPRAPWRRPSLQVLPARDAEIGITVDTFDGAFTTS